MLALAATMLWWLWPARLGGSTTVVIVEGRSMEPTYHAGDLIVTHRHHRYNAGDIVVFRATVPGRTQPALVVHRLLQVSDDGHITTQGDNRTNPDGFLLTVDDIVGRAELKIPDGGTLLWFASRWWTLAAVTGLLVTLSLWPPRITTTNGPLDPLAQPIN